jgi:N-methylhydantoinase A
VATNNMEHAIRIVSVERGRDPRRYAMVAFGGAGPLHAARLARKIGVPQVIIPKNAGVGSAIGLLSADARVDASTTRILRLNETSGATIAALYDGLEIRVQEDLARLALPGAAVWSRFAYMRFAGQGFEIHVPLPSGDIGPEYPEAAEAAFRTAYEKRHRFSDEDAAAEAVDWYLVATIETAKTNHPDAGSLSSNKSERKTRSAYFPDAGGWLKTEIIRRANLTLGQDIQGPVIIEDPDSTIIVPPGDTIERTLRGHLLIRIDVGETP